MNMMNKCAEFHKDTDTTFVRMRGSDNLGDAKKVEKRHLTSSNLTCLRIATDENDFRKIKEEG